ncbi:MAG TPA: hypothetical protein VJO99_22265 [Burkholderiaceae bacterium]|nr:hypothetical protein [Burkholderiaceae bacterium]
MKTHQIEIQRVKAMNNSHGLIRVQVDALVQASAAGRGDGGDAAPSSVLTMSEETARVMLLLIKSQLAEFDSRKPRSRRGDR